MSYEGIQKLCFECSRMGHRKESCPYTIRQELPAREVLLEAGIEEGEGSHENCEASSPKNGVGPNGQAHNAVQEVVHVGTYGPWVVVAHRRNGTKSQRGGRSPLSQRNVRSGVSKGHIVLDAPGMQGSDKAEVVSGPTKENKRRLSPTRVLEKAQVESSIQNIGNKDLKQAQPNSVRDQEPNLLRLTSAQIETTQTALKHSSVKGKRVLVRQRVSQHSLLSAADNGVGRKFLSEHLKGKAEELVKDGGIRDEDASKGFQFNAAIWSKMGYGFRGGNCGDSRGSVGGDKSKSNSSVRVVQQGVGDNMEVHGSFDKDECEEWVGPSNRSGWGGSSEPMVESSGGCAFTGGGVLASVGKPALNALNDCFVKCESNGTDEEGAKVG